jgi:hypothetical protein
MSNDSNVIDLFSAFAVDQSAEQTGTKVQLPGAGDTLFTIARQGNKAYAKLMQQRWKQNRTVLESKGDVAEARSEEILIEVVAKTILLGWDGKIRFGKENLEYSLDNAKRLLALKEFRAVVLKAADDLENFKAVKDAEDKENL